MMTDLTSRLVRIAGMVLLGASVVATPAKAQSPYVGEVGLFAGVYCPMSWLPADGRLLQISQYTLLFSLMGTTYGGNGQTNFALPKVSVPTANGPVLTTCVATNGTYPVRGGAFAPAPIPPVAEPAPPVPAPPPMVAAPPPPAPAPASTPQQNFSQQAVCFGSCSNRCDPTQPDCVQQFSACVARCSQIK